jgi:hypothetical protein
MDEISNQQIYDLALDISHDVAKLETSIDELLVEMRMRNQDLSSYRQRLAKLSQSFPKASPT